jgi:AcrR family transcriptional regulator
LATARLLDRPRILHGSTETETAVFKATESLLAAQPFGELSVAQIIDKAGISRGSFYKYFSSKLGVIAGLLVSVMDAVFDTAAPFLVRPGVSLAESLRTSMTNAMDVWTEHRILLRVVMENWPASMELEAQWCGAMAHFAEAVATEIDQEREAARLPAGLPSDHLAMALIWSTERCLYIAGRQAEQSSADERAQIDALVAMWVGTLQAGCV